MTIDPVGHASQLERWAMARALALADRVTSSARPNPGVGCVLLNDGQVVGEGATRPVGGAHAEVVALRAAGDRAHGATAVVTLEPCSHHGRTPPCSEALMAAGIARVVLAVADPGALAGGGAARLRASGVEVEHGLFADAAREVHRVFLIAAAASRAALTLKVAMTVDGAMAHPSRRWVTGPQARRRVHELRAAADGVLVGVGTVLADDPRLDARDVPATGPAPRPIILDTRLSTPVDARVLRPGAVIISSQEVDEAAVRRIEDRGADVLRVEVGPDGHVSPLAALRALAERSITSVLAEPGPHLGSALLRDGVADDVVLHVAPDVADRDDLPTVAPALAHPLDLGIRRLRMLGDDLEIHLRPNPAR